MNIKHEPLFDTKLVEEHYSKKDGVPIKYVVSTEVPGKSHYADIFYRETPHPEFGNRYFGLHKNDEHIGIFDCDDIEKCDFAMITDGKTYVYSSYRHDFKTHGDNFIDGGRSYYRSSTKPDVFKIVNGEFQLQS